MPPKETSEHLHTFPISTFFVQRLDKLDDKLLEEFGYSPQFDALLKKRPDLAFQSVSIFLLAFFTLPFEVLVTYSFDLAKGAVTTTRNILKGGKRE